MSNELIQQLLAPVVMISACGMLCLAQFARLTAITARLREFNKERLQIASRQRASDDDAAALSVRSEGLMEQAHRLLANARMIQRALLALVGCIILMGLCSLSLGASLVWPALSRVADGFFVAGIGCILIGMVVVWQELRIALDLVRYETRRVDDVAASSRSSERR